MACFCYILECSDGSFYTGWTTDPERRLRQHNRGTGAKYTRTRRPVRMVYLEELPDRSAAMRREIQIKQMTRERKTKLIKNKQGGQLAAPLELTDAFDQSVNSGK